MQAQIQNLLTESKQMYNLISSKTRAKENTTENEADNIKLTFSNVLLGKPFQILQIVTLKKKNKKTMPLFVSSALKLFSLQRNVWLEKEVELDSAQEQYLPFNILITTEQTS